MLCPFMGWNCHVNAIPSQNMPHSSTTGGEWRPIEGLSSSRKVSLMQEWPMRRSIIDLRSNTSGKSTLMWFQ